ncbi:phosphotransferase [Chitinophaga sancti]|uniref:phosphotransferase n=1 Tax=Chitinophaga sancti TaxID=1004 RepID=UPI002A760953|nr:phosphotransferase [Chitinophaga sancti]WPQ61077.1 phosphotransferase [Chitinophaga sancti]
MTHFPVVSSILSAQYLVPLFQVKYNLSRDTTCRLLKAGVNHSYLVTDGDNKYIFRIYCINWRTKKDIAEEIRLLNLLRAHAMPVTYPIADFDNDYVQLLHAPEGLRYGVLFSYAHGEKILQYPTALHYKMGATIARLHQVTENFKLDRVDYTPAVMVVDSFERLKGYLPLETEEMQWMQQAQDYLLKLYATIDHSRVRNGAVHMDLWFDNMNIANDEFTIFDFDFCGNGMLCYDLAYYILQVHSTERENTEVCKEKVAAFLEGYSSITTISEEEKALIPAFGISMYFFYLGIQCQRYEDWSNTFLNEVYLKRFIKLLIKRYADLYELAI